MSAQRFRLFVAVAVVGCLAWAALEARRVTWRVPRDVGCSRAPVDPAAVAESFRPILEAERAGREEEALLALRERAEKGPHPGYAWFLLGEAAYQAGAYEAAVRSYRKAVETDPSVTDRGSALRASWALRGNLEVIQKSAWAGSKPPELADLRYLQRRLMGGCE
jgi:cytochrome c-type biogenesis protein CcmH/NrfG